VCFFFFSSEWNDTKTNDWTKERKPELKSEDRNSALLFLNKKGIKSWNANEVQLWLTIVRDGTIANDREKFRTVGTDLITLTKDDIIKVLGNDIVRGGSLYNAIQEGLKNLTCFPLCSIQLMQPFLFSSCYSFDSSE
jgi:hypothetical protein